MSRFCLQSEQQRLVQHNEDIKDQAKVLGFDVVDTFQMTMARYKDFLQGKCACHFHRVIRGLLSTSGWHSIGQHIDIG